MGERRGPGKSRNMYKGPMGRDNRVGIDCLSGVVGRAGNSNGRKIGNLTTIKKQMDIYSQVNSIVISG